VRAELLFVILLSCAAKAAAHDFWIEPSTFRPAVGETVTLSLRVGQDFAGDPVARSAQLVESFVVRDAAGERAIPGIENRDPAGFVRVERAGLAMIGYRSKPYPLTLPADRFEQFLRDEGLERILALRERGGQSKSPDRERFYRFAKTMLVTGAAASGFDRPFGYRYELVPETNAALDAPLRVRVLFEGKPLAGALVTAISGDDPAARIARRSDAHGRVVLPLGRRGVWLIKSVQMVAAPPGVNADWESLWASVTFER
jgi:uncharacterized GH25 family protein